MKLFLALDFDSRTQKNIFEIQKILKKNSDKGRWAYYKNIHLTIKFIGDVDIEKVPEISGIIESEISRRKPMEFTLDRLGFFRGKNIISVAWIGLDGDVENLVDLNHNIEYNFAKIGISKERKKFLPHISLGREIEFNTALFNVEDLIKKYLHEDFVVNSLTLYSSRQENNNRVYEPLKRFEFKR